MSTFLLAEFIMEIRAVTVQLDLERRNIDGILACSLPSVGSTLAKFSGTNYHETEI